MNKEKQLEAKILVENAGNYYDEEETEYITEQIYPELLKNVGFKDERRDKRYIVKFHDIFYYAPEENDETLDYLFDDFCNFHYEDLKEYFNEKNIDIDYMLTAYDVGNYRAFLVDIREITEENAIQLAMEIFETMQFEGREYVKNYITIVNALQELEDNYMDYWIEFLEDAEYSPKKLNEIKEKYNRDRERKN